MLEKCVIPHFCLPKNVITCTFFTDSRLNLDFVIQGLRQRASQFALPDAKGKSGAQSRALFHAPVQGTRPDDEHGKLN